jgi:SagB-type dehydrogenase family enzyme
MVSEELGRSLAWLFHLNSMPPQLSASTDEAWDWPFRYSDPSPGPTSVLLPGPSCSAFIDMLRKRGSARDFTAGAISAEALSSVLMATAGVLGVREVLPGMHMGQLPTPSAGGFYPISVSVVVERVHGVPDGLYRYRGDRHSLDPVLQGPMLSDMRRALLDQVWVERANGCLVFSVDLERPLRKYGSRGYRFALIEAGHMAQNTCLAAGDVGLGSVCVGGFDDDALSRVLGDATERGLPLYCVLIGIESR